MSVWWPGEWDRLVAKVEDWVLKRQGYNKLQSCRLSRCYTSMINKSKSDLACTTFHFSSGNQKCLLQKGKKYLYQSSSAEISDDIADHCLNSIDKMDIILKQHERAFAKLPKREPIKDSYSIIYNRNLDLLNEDVIQNIFLKCYNGKKNEIIISKV